MKIISSVKGMNDIMPEETAYWNMVENIWYKVIKSYCYDEVRTPVLENLELFYSSIGQQTDIVSKELFTFSDRNNINIALRPEGTASCVRSIINNNLLYNGTQRVWYKGNMFRYENTQKGRYRQFNQIGIEALGFKSTDIEIEQISIVNRFFKEIFITDIHLEINSIGSKSTREKYKTKLVEYLNSYDHLFDNNTKKQLRYNPLRILDSKNIEIKNILKKAPLISTFYTKSEIKNLEVIETFLQDNNIKYIKNPHLVRGLDYYNDFVFEFVSKNLGSQGAICAGGRYDNLVKNISKGKMDVKCFGCAIGLERVMLLLDKNKFEKEGIDIFFASIGDKARKKAFFLSETLKNNLKNIKIFFHLGDESENKQIKKAQKLKANFICIISDYDILQKNLLIISLKNSLQKYRVKWKDFNNFFHKRISKNDH